ncbi:MAG TPA: hypothetical protein VFV38_13760 [Ktedonobacteraceae bacterium]|nr:hypothetical protein [Ktedonobacteraceae bacterium]
MRWTLFAIYWSGTFPALSSSIHFAWKQVRKQINILFPWHGSDGKEVECQTRKGQHWSAGLVDDNLQAKQNDVLA